MQVKNGDGRTDTIRLQMGLEMEDPMVIIEGTWAKVAGVWVPETIRMQDFSNARRLISYALAFEWEQVNCGVEKQLFEVEAMGLLDKNRLRQEGHAKARDADPRTFFSVAHVIAWILGSCFILGGSVVAIVWWRKGYYYGLCSGVRRR